MQRSGDLVQDERLRKRFLASEAVQYKDLLLMLTWRDIRIKYKQSVMGFLWAILMPILIVSSGCIVMIAFSTVSGRPVNMVDVLSVAVKAVPWAFVVGAIRFATQSLVANKELVTKIYFPREILPLACVLANLFDFAVAAGVIALLFVALRVGCSLTLLWVPVLLVLLTLLTAGLALLLACANLFFRDVKYLVEVALTYGVFFTPVFYPASKLGKWGLVILLNPVSPILEAVNRVMILRQPPDAAWLSYSAAWAIFGFGVAWKIFQKAEPAFAESI
jgi:lipopolysaccharide transport system permease protein